MSPELVRALATILFGALAGGLTNTVAVWMLFHPYYPPTIGGRRLSFLHGAIPKNQARLAAAVGKTVGTRLLTESDLAGTLGNTEFRGAFDERLRSFLARLLEEERGSLREMVPEGFHREMESLLEGVADQMAHRLDDWIASERFESGAEETVSRFLERMSDEPVGALLTPAREAAITGALEGWASEAVEREGFREAVDDYLERTFTNFLQEDRTFQDVLPAGLVGSLERALSGYLPVAVRKLGGVLEDPQARARLESALHDLFQRFLRDLKFHQRVVARLVVTEDTLDRVLEALEAEGTERLSEMLREETVQDAIARRVNEAVLDFLARPVTAVLGTPEDANVVKARETAVGWVLGMARDPATRGFLLDRLRQALGKASEGTWGDLLGSVPPARIAEGVVAGARSDGARELYRNALRKALVGLLDRPIGRPADWLPEGATDRIATALSDPLWSWLQAQVPEVVRTLDVGRRVEEKVMGFPVARMEEIVRRVTERELLLIVRLGYVLGAIIGGVLVTLDALF